MMIGLLHENALQVFYDNIQQHPDAVFFFSAFQNVEADTGKSRNSKIIFC